MTGHAQKAANRRGRATDVKYRLKHSRHRARRARTHRHQKGAAPVAKSFASGIFEKLYSFRQAIRKILHSRGFAVYRRRTKADWEHECRRHRQTETGHARQVGCLPADNFDRILLGQSVTNAGNLHFQAIP